MAVPFIQTSFAAGELSPSLFGHVDFSKFKVGLSTCRNLFLSYRGGAYSRAGTSFCGFSKQTGRSHPPRLITFQFSINQGLALEWGHHYMRVITDGAYVTEASTAISGITRANPGVVTDNAHGYANGDWVYLAGIGGMTQLNQRTLVIANATANTYTLQDVYGTNIDTTGYTAYTSGGTASRIYTLVTPYADQDLNYLKFTQSADVMSLTCWNQITGTAYPPYDLARIADNNWTLTVLVVGSTIAAPASCSGSATVPASGTNKPTDYQYVATAVDALTSEESVASPIANISNSVDIAITAGSLNINCATVAGAGYYNFYKALPAYNSTVPVGSLFGYAGSAYGTSFVDSNIVSDFSQVPPLHTDPFGGGQILNAIITAGGSGLTTVTYTITTSTGSGAAGYPVIVGGALTAFVFTNPGNNYAPGDTMAFNGAGYAGGAITFGSIPSPGDTITLNGLVWTFVTTVTSGHQTQIQTDLATTLVQLASDLSAFPYSSLRVASYSVNATILTVAYNSPGTAGNSYTLAASSATPSGATLTGGSGTGGVAASGSYAFGVGNPTNLQTIILNGVTWTFVAAGPVGNQTVIGGSLAATLAQLQIDLTASVVVGIHVANYSVIGTTLNITYGTVGVAGNAYTIAAGTYGGTPSGATLTGGVDGPTTPSATLVIGPASGGYPSVVTYFQERRVYMGSPNNPDTYWMSQPGAFKNFDSRIPPIPSDAITGTPWSVEVNGIQAGVPMPGGLVVLTGLSAWQLTGAGGSSLNPQPITPVSQQAQPQAYNGCHDNIPPLKIDDQILYVQAKGSILRDLSYNYFVNIYTGTDLTFLSSHLFTGYQLLEMAWCEEPYKLLWATRDDGVLLSLTFLKAEDVMAWGRHDTNGQFWSLCAVTEPPVDALYVATQRYPGGKNAYMVERMDNRLWPVREQAWCVDAGLTLTLPTPNATLTASSATGAGIPTSATGLVGGSGYSSSTTVAINDPTGSGCVVTPTIAGGAITALAFAGGTNYTYPQLVFTDPAQTGSGASATVVLNNSATFTASGAVFNSGMVGSTIRMGGGKATVTAYTDTQHLTANIISPIILTIPNSGGVPQIAMSGAWSIASNVTTISGLDHLAGATVTGLADGVVIAPTTVSASGTITLSNPASLVTIGLGFQAQVQSLYLDAGAPTVQGRRKKVAAVTVRLEGSGVETVLVGCNQPDGSVQSPPQNSVIWSNLTPLSVAANQNLPPYGSSVAPLYTGDTLAVPITGGFAKPGQIALQQDAPLPLQVLALIPDVLPGDMPEDAVTPRQQDNGGQSGRRRQA